MKVHGRRQPASGRASWRPLIALALVAVALFLVWEFDFIDELRPSPGRIDHLMVNFPSLGGKPHEVYVYVPRGYSAEHRRFPVVYALHGWPGGPRDFFAKGRISDTAEKMMALGQLRPMLIVAPSGAGPGLLHYGGWANSIDGKVRLEDFLARDLPAYIDSLYRTVRRPEGRAIMGISEGGYGATNIGLKHPDVFSLIISHTGHYYAGTATMSQRVFGRGDAGRSYRAANSPMLTLRAMEAVPKGLQVFMDTTPTDSDYADSKAFAAVLRTKHVAHTFQVVKGGHSWRVWRDRFPISLQWASRRLKTSRVRAIQDILTSAMRR